MITVKDLSIKLAGNTLLENLNLEIKEGEFWAVIGKNGTGKTTLLHCIAGILPIDKGDVLIDTIRMSEINHLIRAQYLSLLPQTQESSLNCTVKQAISYGRYAWHKNHNNDDEIFIRNALQEMELENLANKSIQQLSGGELRKVEIATILAQDSTIMLLDEPLNHLDLPFRVKLMQKLKRLSQNKAIIMVTHDIQYVQQYCSHVLMLNGKNQLRAGEVNNVLTESNLTKILGIQSPETVLMNL